MIITDIQFSDTYLMPEDMCLKACAEQANLSLEDRKTIETQAADIIRACRKSAGHGSVFDAILQEYGLSSEEGVTLMRLVEALIRTVDEKHGAFANSR